jgi:uncharacterized protein
MQFAKKIFGLSVFLTIGLFLIFKLFDIGSFFNKDGPKLSARQGVLSPTPVPFYDLTMPYLFGRSYDSRLGAITKYKEQGSYTLYLTSFASDGLKVNGLLTIPNRPAEKFPAIVFVHGYIAPAIYRTTERYEDYVDYLARNGFVVFKIDLRGNGSSEGEAGGAYYSNDYTVDTLNAYSALQNADFVDPKAVGIWGHSMAGNVTFKAFAAKKDIPALVIWAGAGYTYTDLKQYKLNDRSYRPPDPDNMRLKKRQQLIDTYGDFDPDNPFWKQVPATNYLNGVKGAVELHHAVDDPVVNIEYSRNLMKILDATDIPHKLYEYNSGGHNISGTSFALAMKRTVEFFHQYLK